MKKLGGFGFPHGAQPGSSRYTILKWRSLPATLRAASQIDDCESPVSRTNVFEVVSPKAQAVEALGGIVAEPEEGWHSHGKWASRIGVFEPVSETMGGMDVFRLGVLVDTTDLAMSDLSAVSDGPFERSSVVVVDLAGVSSSAKAAAAAIRALST